MFITSHNGFYLSIESASHESVWGLGELNEQSQLVRLWKVDKQVDNGLNFVQIDIHFGFACLCICPLNLAKGVIC